MKKLLSLLLTLSLVLITAPVARTQTKDSAESTTNDDVQDWQGLIGVRPGTKVLVELKSGRTGEVKVVSLVGGTLTIADARHTYTLEQSAVQKVYLLRKGSRSKAARIGAGIGMVLGTFIGVGLSLKRERAPGHISSEADMTPAFVGLYVGTFAGAGVGAVFGRKGKKELLYEAKYLSDVHANK